MFKEKNFKNSLEIDLKIPEGQKSLSRPQKIRVCRVTRNESFFFLHYIFFQIGIQVSLVYGALFGNNPSITSAVSRKLAAVWRSVSTFFLFFFSDNACRKSFYNL